MTRQDGWREVHARHFPGLPFDCGEISDPGVRFSEDLRDWSHKATTPDQRRMERYIDRYDLRRKRILHIGVGNSSLAKRFHRRVKEIVGTTVDQPEIDVAASLGFSNYRVVMHNKYAGTDEGLDQAFDFILDNNPTSPCCCFRHFSTMLDFYARKLSNDGQVVTDLMGLQWVPDDANPRWSFDFEDLAIVAQQAGLSPHRIDGRVFVLSRSPPARPGLLPLARHLARRAWMLPGQIARNGPGELSRLWGRLTGTRQRGGQ